MEAGREGNVTMGYFVIGLASGAAMLISALVAGWGLGPSLLLGWLGGSLGVSAAIAVAAARMSAPIRAETNSKADPLRV